ncbi:hypothetical protein ADL01_32535 [Streptomyces sp. NRRL WC-3618]|nr:hypothetical protein ADL01_32535 [Streptomyces sp. NRRL WC-3618]
MPGRLHLVQRLDEKDRPDTVRGARRRHQVLQRRHVLLRRFHAVEAVAVQRVQRAAAQRLGQTRGHLDVGAEPFGLLAGHRQGAPVRARQLSGVEVQAVGCRSLSR